MPLFLISLKLTPVGIAMSLQMYRMDGIYRGYVVQPALVGTWLCHVLTDVSHPTLTTKVPQI
ncbi:hypothetical protein H6F61_28690 [Cyanobacteria bacterium FACHB-472]|nr:hypothetical protein [Cyanobacteria bacterium FACHB-472]